MSFVQLITTRERVFRGTTEQCVGACEAMGWKVTRNADGFYPAENDLRVCMAVVVVGRDGYGIDEQVRIEVFGSCFHVRTMMGELHMRTGIDRDTRSHLAKFLAVMTTTRAKMIAETPGMQAIGMTGLGFLITDVPADTEELNDVDGIRPNAETRTTFQGKPIRVIITDAAAITSRILCDDCRLTFIRHNDKGIPVYVAVGEYRYSGTVN